MSSSGLGEGLVRVGICTSPLLACLICGEHPGDAGAFGIATTLPGGDLGLETLALGDAAVQALGAENADFDHVQPTCMLGREVKRQAAQHPVLLARGKGLVERPGRAIAYGVYGC